MHYLVNQVDIEFFSNYREVRDSLPYAPGDYT